jgi:cytochrome c oxidase subunit II
MPPNASLHGLAVDHLMRWNLGAMLACFVAAHVWLIAAMMRSARRRSGTLGSGAGDTGRVVRERFKKQQQALPETSRRFIWPLLAILVVMYAWMAITAQHLWAANRFEGASPEAMQVEVTGEQFQWYFRYPGSDARFGHTRPSLVNAAAGNPLGLDPQDASGADDLVSSALTLPVGHEVDLRLRSLDVIHGFFVPAMRLKQNAVPGLVLHIHFTPTAVGTYPILCSQICGLGHQRMQAQMRVVSAHDYQDWLQAEERRHAREQQEQGPAQ